MSINNGTDLFSFYRMMQTADIFGAQQLTEFDLENRFNSNTSVSDSQQGQIKSFYEQLLQLMIETDSRGIYPIDILIKKIEELTTNIAGKTNEEEFIKNIKYAIRAYSTRGTLKVNNQENLFQDGYVLDVSNPTDVKKITNVNNIAGWSDQDRKIKSNLGVVLATTPLINPQLRSTKKIEFFLNNIPSYMASRLTPYVDVKFQFERQALLHAKGKNNTFGLLKFLQGANLKFDLSNNNSPSANELMYNGNIYQSQNDESNNPGSTFYRAGMEAFLTPQTLVNPNFQNIDDRFVPVIDKFRPLASLVSVDISIQPKIGFLTYKSGTITIRLHDRSRLHEISDIVRPQLFKGTTIWLTYGWRHPIEENNPYATFINHNMLNREALMVVNSEFSFDDAGQVEIKLKVATHASKTIEISSVVGDDVRKHLRRFEEVRQQIEYISQRLNLSPPQGVKDEVRAYEMLDFAARGAIPDMPLESIRKALTGLENLLDRSAEVVKDASLTQEINNAKASLREIYDNKDPKKNMGKFSELLKNSYEEEVANKFSKVAQGPDPWLLTNTKEILDEIPTYMHAGIQELISEYQYAESMTKFDKKAKYNRRSVVSFGKLFTIFVGDAIASHKEMFDEVQIWFYKMNDNCGPASSINLASFPIELPMFIKKYTDYVIEKRAQNVSIREFISLVLSTQFGDVRGLGYGMRRFYKPYDPKNQDPQVLDRQQSELETAVQRRQKKYGVFKKPALQIYIESAHAKSEDTPNKTIDLLHLLEYIDSPDRDMFGGNIAADSYRRILRLHVYDKAADPYPLPKNLLRDKLGGIVEIPNTSIGKGIWSKLMDAQRIYGPRSQQFETAAVDIINQKGNNIKIQLPKHPIQPNQGTPEARIKLTEEISKHVPTIFYGSNASTIMNASVSTKADARVSTVNIIRPVGNPVTLEPNGSALGGLPVRVIPATMNMTTLGCPHAHPAQFFYFDFGTGTTVDNLYILTHVTHNLSPGKFETSWQFGYADGYARYEAMPTVIDNFNNLEIPESDS